MRGLEPLTSCMRSINPELPNLLNLLEAIDIVRVRFSKPFPILAAFGISWNLFLTRILTQHIGSLIVGYLQDIFPPINSNHYLPMRSKAVQAVHN